MQLENSHHTETPVTDQPLNETEAAARLGLKVATLRAWRHQGRGPAYVRLGRAVRYLATDIDDYLHSNRHTARAERSSPGTSSPSYLGKPAVCE
jgi:excisionase family DNA binding protein